MHYTWRPTAAALPATCDRPPIVKSQMRSSQKANGHRHSPRTQRVVHEAHPVWPVLNGRRGGAAVVRPFHPRMTGDRDGSHSGVLNHRQQPAFSSPPHLVFEVDMSIGVNRDSHHRQPSAPSAKTMSGSNSSWDRSQSFAISGFSARRRSISSVSRYSAPCAITVQEASMPLASIT